MRISRREALSVSGSLLTGLALGLKPELVQARQAPQSVPDHLVDSPVREVPELHLLPDGSAREFTAQEIGTISEPDRWRPAGQAPHYAPIRLPQLVVARKGYCFGFLIEFRPRSTSRSGQR